MLLVIRNVAHVGGCSCHCGLIKQYSDNKRQLLWCQLKRKKHWVVTFNWHHKPNMFMSIDADLRWDVVYFRDVEYVLVSFVLMQTSSKQKKNSDKKKKGCRYYYHAQSSCRSTLCFLRQCHLWSPKIKEVSWSKGTWNCALFDYARKIVFTA